MIFSSYIFVFCFLPITLVVYYIFSSGDNSIFQRLFLIFASLFFYGFGNPKYLILLSISLFINYSIALLLQNLISHNYRKILFLFGILFNIGLLIYFKYYNFFITNINFIFKTTFIPQSISIPLGISFFTFQQISFLISIYKKEEEAGSIFNYGLFVTFFPQLVAGPIVLYGEMLPQLNDYKRRFSNADNLVKGICLFVIGLFKKVVIADTISTIVDNGFKISEIGFAAALITSVSYTLQIFFDFSGYSDMAVGLGKLFNIDLPFNFAAPYKSESITDFWRRWHITLGRMLHQYLYLPLGGNKKGSIRTCVNLLVTFLASGFWHGADWTFVLWGGCHGFLVVAERLLGRRLEIIPKKVRIAITFLTINFLWILFRAEKLRYALVMYKGILGLSGIKFWQVSQLAEDGIINFPDIINCLYILMLLLFLLFVVFKCKDSRDIVSDFKATRKNAVCIAIIFCIAVLCLSREVIFIYYKF